MGTRLSNLVPLAVLTLGAVMGLGASCDRRPTVRPSSDVRPAAGAEPSPLLRVYYLVDLDGYLEPCGCQSRPLGGIDRLGHVIESERGHAPRSVLVAVGNTYFNEPHLDARMVYQERAKAEALTRIFNGLNLTAYAPGPADFALGADAWRQVSAAAHAPALAANAGMGDVVIHDAGGVRVGIVGVSDFSPADGEAAAGAPAVTDAVASARVAVATARSRGAQVVVVLASVPRRVARAIAGGVPGVDFVVAAREPSDTPPGPERVGSAYLLTATNQGKGLGVLDLYGTGESAFRDASPATVQADRARLDQRIAELQQRVTAWSSDPTTDPTALATQRGRLATMQQERAALDHTDTVATGRYFRARTVEISPDVARSAGIERAIGGYFRTVNDHNRETYASLAPVPAPDGTAHYVGVGVCENCHAEAVQFWRTTPHAHAYRTLEAVSKNFNLSCVGCHVTGYRQPGGSEVVQNDGLRDVQCESCHGPGSLHVGAQGHDQAVATIRRQVPGDYCATQCHTHEHSDHFDYATYRPRILGPGHGMPSADAAARPAGTQ